ncbi:MobF family relaxase [Agromyces sp. NPDC058126]|uniref:MobF family relaxase n=1 Tax=Agromyces sp. NPDC058126 TaxID=3346350 RepID=UPI0036DA27BF
MRGGVTLFRAGGGNAARAYLERDHARADDYYLAEGAGLADRTVFDGASDVVARDVLTGDEYEAWVDWDDPLTGENRGTPRTRKEVDPFTGETLETASSPRFAEMTINVDKTLSIAAAVNPDVSAALDAAMRDAADAMGAYMAFHSRTRIGPLGAQRLVPVEQLEQAAVVHQTSRAGDPHRHIHLQWNTRVYAEGKWRGLDTATTFRQQGALRGIGEAVIGSHPQLREALAQAGFTFDAKHGLVEELTPFAGGMSKRAVQITKNRELLERDWRKSHPGQVPGPELVRAWDRQAWSLDRPDKKPTELSTTERWMAELAESGYTAPVVPSSVTVTRIADLDRAEIARQTVALVSANRSAWSVADLQDKAAHLLAQTGLLAERAALGELLEDITARAANRCLSLADPADGVMPDSLRHLTSPDVLQLHDDLSRMLHVRGQTLGLDRVLDPLTVGGLPLGEQQQAAVEAMAGTHQLTVVEGAAGAGKTTALLAAKEQLESQSRHQLIVAPTLKAAQEAGRATGSQASSLHRLLRQHGYRWNAAGTWSRLHPGELNEHGRIYSGPSAEFTLSPSTQIVVDEAGMVDQEAGRALLQIADEAGASIVLIGDRAQLSAVGRAGFLDLAARHAHTVIDLDQVHRFVTPDGNPDLSYAALTLKMRTRQTPDQVFDELVKRDLIRTHTTTEEAEQSIAHAAAADLAANESTSLTVPTNRDATRVNAAVREELVTDGTVDDKETTLGADGLRIGRGDLLMTRKNDTTLGVANREKFAVVDVHSDGRLTVAGEDRRRITLEAEYVQAHTHLAYAVTDYGNQGATTGTSHTLVTDRMSAGGGYVGATRGRTRNTLHFIAVDLDDARTQFVELMHRDPETQSLDAARQKLRDQVTGLDLTTPAQRAAITRAAAEQLTPAERARQAAAASFPQPATPATERNAGPARDRWQPPAKKAEPERDR